MYKTVYKGIKMLYLYLLGQNCLHLTFSPHLNSETYSRKYEKMPNVLFMHVKILQKRINLLKMCGPQIWLCLFTFRPIKSKQLNSLTRLDTLSWLGGAVVTHSLGVQEVPGSIPGSGKGCYVLFFYLLCICFLFKSTLFVTQFCNSFCNVIFLVYLTYCKICDRL